MNKIIATTQDGQKITIAEVIKCISDRIQDYQIRCREIGFVCGRNTIGKKRAIWAKVGYRQRIQALETTLLCIEHIEAARLNGDADPKACKSRVRRSISHIFGSLKKEASL